MSRAATSRRRGCAFLNAALATPKLSAVMAMLFVSLSLPILVFILVYHYHRTSAAILATLREEVAKTRVATIDHEPLQDEVVGVGGRCRTQTLHGARAARVEGDAAPSGLTSTQRESGRPGSRCWP